MAYKKLTMTLFVACVLLFAIGCTSGESDAQIANPASTHCVENGGTLEIRTGDNGEYGVCKFEDGSECEEWAYFREECKPGDSLINQ